MIVHPFVSSHPVSENSNTYIDAIAKIWNENAEKSGIGCAVELIHHIRKATTYGSQEYSVDDGRGAPVRGGVSRRRSVEPDVR
jgi:hypothetical protein